MTTIPTYEISLSESEIEAIDSIVQSSIKHHLPGKTDANPTTMMLYTSDGGKGRKFRLYTIVDCADATYLMASYGNVTYIGLKASKMRNNPDAEFKYDTIEEHPTPFAAAMAVERKVTAANRHGSDISYAPEMSKFLTDNLCDGGAVADAVGAMSLPTAAPPPAPPKPVWTAGDW